MLLARVLLFLVFAAIGVAGLAPAVAAAADVDRPNILFILTDDQAPWAVGVSGNAQARTPHMDKLFGEGAYLVNSFVVTPVCSPSRASLMTSRYGSELGITDWIHPRKEAELGLDPQAVTWPKLLQAAGYHTGLVGKWHLGTTESHHPTRNGFDYFMGHREGGWSPVDPVLEKDGKNQKIKGLTTDILADEAIRFLKRNQGRPFLLCWHTRAPHTRWLPVAPEDWAPFEAMDPAIPNPDYPKLNVPRVKRMTREYLASTRGVDRNLGRVLGVLDELGLRDKTVVIFTSDHGYNMGHNGIWHKGNGHWVLTEAPAATANIPRGQRPNMYDHSLRVPTAIRWPGRIKPGTRFEQTFSTLDWLPTLLAMAGVEAPEGLTVRGRNALPLLTGADGANPAAWDQVFFGQYSTHHQSRTHMRALRTPKWKLVRDFLNPQRDELYNLEDDPAEAVNLIAVKTPALMKTTRDLHEKLLARMRAINDPVLKTLKQ